MSKTDLFGIKIESADDIVIALAGNPNTGKSTVFNSLTGLNQHTGNWPGKTVATAQGKYAYKNKNFILVDLPGTYSLFANSIEEEIARDFICFGKPNVTVVVADATCLERNLNLLLQILEITNRVVLCVNLLDEAERKNISIDLTKLADLLGIPVVGTSARNKTGLDQLKDVVWEVASGKICPSPLVINYSLKLEKAVQTITHHIQNLVGNEINSKWAALRLIEGEESLLRSMKSFLGLDLLQNNDLQEKLITARSLIETENTFKDLSHEITTTLVWAAEKIGKNVVTIKDSSYNQLDRKIDDILTSKVFGIPIMIALLGLVFWITIQGANLPSNLLADGFFWIESRLTHLFNLLGTPIWIHDIFVLGIYRTLAWVISVMLPPMAIFFPLFTLLEDLGYLPRVAFNLDHYFKKAWAHGKQALTMCMGFGCNAAGVISCRIIDSPRERLIAIITNNFVPCNGRFPTLIALAGIITAGATGAYHSFTAALFVLIAIVLGVIITLMVARILSNTILKGLPSSFILELPPYRRPQVGRIIVRSLLDRTLFVLSRAVTIAAPAGFIIWCMANISINNLSILAHCAQFFDPFARFIGLDGYIMMAFILGLPANEIVIPILIMSYMAKGSMLELETLAEMRGLFIENGWTWLTAICMMLFSLNHWPCGTTLWTIRKETQSWKWTLVSFLVPTITGIIICFITAWTVRLLRLI